MGYFGVCFYQPKFAVNVGTLLRTAHCFGSSFNAVIGKRYRRQGADTTNARKNLPFYEYQTFDEFYKNLPFGCALTGVEIDENAVNVANFNHPPNTIYLLGAEDGGLPKSVLDKCHNIISIPTRYCLNVAVAGGIILYDRERGNYETQI